MKPKLKDMEAWRQAELLMQPTLLRVLDNIRKQIEQSTWEGTYEEVETPIPGYQLCLHKQEQQVQVQVWELCYRVCFRDYIESHTPAETVEVEIDTDLLDENGEVDWTQLEEKTVKVIDNLFANLPNA
jgi:hypothetical protein